MAKKTTKKKRPARPAAVSRNVFDRSIKVRDEKFDEVWEEMKRLEELIEQGAQPPEDNVKNSLVRLRTGLKRAEDNAAAAVHASDQVKERLARLEVKVGPSGAEPPELTAINEKIEGLRVFAQRLGNRVEDIARGLEGEAKLYEPAPVKEGLKEGSAEWMTEINRINEESRANSADEDKAEEAATDIAVLASQIIELRNKMLDWAQWRVQVTGRVRKLEETVTAVERAVARRFRVAKDGSTVPAEDEEKGEDPKGTEPTLVDILDVLEFVIRRRSR